LDQNLPPLEFHHAGKRHLHILMWLIRIKISGLMLTQFVHFKELLLISKIIVISIRILTAS